MKSGKNLLLVLSIILITSVSSLCQTGNSTDLPDYFNEMKPTVIGTRFYSVNEGSRTILVVTSKSGPNENIHFWLFDNTDMGWQDYRTAGKSGNRITTQARAKQIDVYWNKNINKYVISHIQGKSTLVFTFIDPDTGEFTSELVTFKSKKKISTGHTIYNNLGNYYMAVLSDNTNFSLVHIDGESFEITGSKSWFFTVDDQKVKSLVGDLTFSPAFNYFYMVLIEPDLNYMRTIRFRDYDDKKIKSAKTFYYTGDWVPFVTLYTFKKSANENRIFFSYSWDSPQYGFNILSNYISKSGKPGRTFFHLNNNVDRPITCPSINAINEQVVYITYTYNLFDYNYYNIHKHGFSTYILNCVGARTNGDGDIERYGYRWYNNIQESPSSIGGVIRYNSIDRLYTWYGKTYF